MTIATVTEIKCIENKLANLNGFGFEVDLEEILIEEFNQELPSDINNIA